VHDQAVLEPKSSAFCSFNSSRGPISPAVSEENVRAVL
jgi:hypothetical protein